MRSDFACFDDCSNRASSATHDPSFCTRDTTGTHSCNSGGTCPAPTRACSISADCGSGKHCTSGQCYADQAGCACSISADCGSGAHCTSGLCYADQAGSKCSISADCGSGAHCTSGMCYRDQSGQPCSISADCGQSSSCVQGRCN